MHCDIWLNFHSTPCWLRNKSSVSKIFCLVLLVYFDLKLSKAWYKIISNVFLLKIIFWSDSKMPLAKLARWLSLIVIHFKIKFWGKISTPYFCWAWKISHFWLILYAVSPEKFDQQPDVPSCINYCKYNPSLSFVFPSTEMTFIGLNYFSQFCMNVSHV